MGTLLLIPLLTAGLAAPGASVPMTLHKIVDDKGTRGVAYNYLAPKGWKVSAQLAWTDRIIQPTIVEASAQSPDGSFGYGITTAIDFAFGGTTDTPTMMGVMPGQHHGLMPPQRLSAFLEAQLRRNPTTADLKVTKRTDRPLTAKELPSFRNFGVASELEFTFTQNGRAMVGSTVARMDVGYAGNPNAQGQAYSGDWELTNALSITCPAGEEKKAMRFFALAVPTYTPTRAFLLARGSYIVALDQQIRDQNAALVEMTKIRSRMSRQQEDAIMGRYRSQQGARDKAQQDFCDYIGDVRRNRDLDGTELQTNSNDGQPWTDGHGNYAFGNSPGVGWTALKPMGG